MILVICVLGKKRDTSELIYETVIGPRSVEATKRSNTTSKEQQLQGRRRAERSYSTFKVRRGNFIQGKEQWLHFAGAAIKRYPTSKVRETQVRQ